MRAFVKRFACVLVGALALVGLVGCGLLEPRSATDVLARYAKAKDRTNYHCDAELTIKPTVLGQTIEFPLDVSADVVGDRSHSHTTAELFGEKIAQEGYMEKDGKTYVQYTSMSLGNDTLWYRSTTSAGDSMDEVAKSLIDSKLLDEAQFEKVDDGYKVTMSGKSVTKLVRRLGGAAGGSGPIDLSELFKSAEAGDVVVVFDTDCLPKSATLSVSMSEVATKDSETSDAASSDLGNLTMFADFSADLQITFSNYGGIKEADVTVPKDVRDSASDLDALADATAGSGAEASA